MDLIEMALTRSFRETVAARIVRDAGFRQSLLEEAVSLFIAGDIQTGKAVLRDFVNATIGFEELSVQTGTPAKSLMRMLGPRGNPTAANLFSVLRTVQKAEGLQLTVATTR